MIEIALFQPQIPQNTGNIGRLAVGFNVPLSLIKPLGFEMSDKHLKRAGLDYWQYLDYHVYEDQAAFFKAKKNRPIVCFSKKGQMMLADYSFAPGTIVLMGQETKGVPEEIIAHHGIARVRIPMLGKIRSYNLANAAAIAVYEAHRQLGWG